MVKKNNNLDWLIAARGYAMFLVFFAHLTGAIINALGITSLVTVLQHCEPIVSPFFAMLTGAFYSRGTNSFREYAKLKFGQRMFPVYFYLLLVIPFYLAFPFQYITSLKLIPLYLVGIPFVSWSSWFLVALFTSEMFYFFIYPHATTTAKRIAIALLCYTLARLYSQMLYNLPGAYGVFGIVWMFHTVFLFCAFFLVGAVMKPFIISITHWPVPKLILVGTGSLLLFQLGLMTNEYMLPVENSFARPFVNDQMIAVSSAMYGEYFPFLLCTLFGPLTLLCFARLIPVTRFMRSCGDYSLILLGLNGIFLKVLNWHIIFMLPKIENTFLESIPYAFLMSAISLAICLPIAILLSKWFPQLTGRPMLVGPILPPLYKKQKNE